MLRLIITTLLASLLMTGCTGIITGYEYTKSDLVVVYKVVKGGVTAFMTQEQIEKLKLDKADVVVTDTWKVLEKNDVASVSTDEQ